MDMFSYVMVLASIIIGLAITHLLQGIAGMVQHPGRAKPYWIHLVWVIYGLMQVTFWWWWEFRFQATHIWTFQLYAFVLGYAVLMYMLCALLFPREVESIGSFKDYFYARRGWFFGVNAASFAIDMIDTALKGATHFASLGPEYWFATAANIGFSIAAIFIRNERFQGIWAIAALAYQLSWAIRYYDTVQ